MSEHVDSSAGGERQSSEVRSRRGARFSLRTLLIVGVIVSIGLGLVGRYVHRKRSESAAIEALKNAEAEIYFDFQKGDGPGRPLWNAPPPGLRRVTLIGENFTDASIESLGRIDELERLAFRDTRITGSGLRRLANRERLTEFYYDGQGESLADDPLLALDATPNLQELSLHGESLTVRQMRTIARLKQLEELIVVEPTSVEEGAWQELAAADSVTSILLHGANAAPWNDGDLKAFAEMDRLEKLIGPGRDVTDEGLAALARAPRLRSLFVDFPQITDAGAASLSKIATLENLMLRDTQVTDEGLRHLSRLPNAKHFHVSPPITIEAARRFAAEGRSREALYFHPNTEDRGGWVETIYSDADPHVDDDPANE